MKLFQTLCAIAMFAVCFTAQAGEIVLKGAHLCCGKCDKGLTEALTKVSGVTEINISDKKVVTFQVSDDKVKTAAIKSISKAGFFGKTTYDGKKVKFPKTGAKKKGSVNSITLYSMHICCGKCVKGVNKALEKVEGVDSVKPDMKKGQTVVTGKKIKVTALMKALHKAGFQASLKPPAKDKKASS